MAPLKRPASATKGKQVSLFDFFGKKTPSKKAASKNPEIVKKEDSSSVIKSDEKLSLQTKDDAKAQSQKPSVTPLPQATETPSLAKRSSPPVSSKRPSTPLSASPKVKKTRTSSSSSRRSVSSNKDSKRRRYTLEDTDDEEEKEWQEEEKKIDSESDFEDEGAEEEQEEKDDFICDDDEDDFDDAAARKKRKTTSTPSAKPPRVSLSSQKCTSPLLEKTPPKASRDLASFTCGHATPGSQPRSISGSTDMGSTSSKKGKTTPMLSTQESSISRDNRDEAAHVTTPPKFVKGALNPLGSHVHNHLGFLNPPRDAQGRAADHPEYDCRTLRIVKSDWEKVTGSKMSEAVLQWWEIKAQYFDTVLLFKTGKFYEMFHMDADIGVKVLGLSMMKGHLAHAGFPEKNYGTWSNRLVRAGYKVARVEQTETPSMLDDRKKNAPKGTKVGSAVNREVCSVLSLGTRTCGFLEQNPTWHTEEMDTEHVGTLLAIAERPLGTQADDACLVREFGTTLIDAPRGWVTIGQFRDDALCSHLQTLLAAYSPSEFLCPAADSDKSCKQQTSLKSLLVAYRAASLDPCRVEVIRPTEAFPKSTALDPRIKKQLERTSPVHPWNVDETIQELHRREYFETMPEILRAVSQNVDKNELAMASFGAALFYLQRNLVDAEILSMGVVREYTSPTSTLSIGSVTTMHDQDSIPTQGNGSDSANASTVSSVVSSLAPKVSLIDAMSLEGTTLHNLEVIANASDGKVSGSLWSKLCHTKTPHGSRLLKAWVLRPLFEKDKIERRADAVEELASGAGALSCKLARNVLAKCGDIERLLSRVHSMSGSEGKNGEAHPNERAVLYEEAEYTKRKVGDFSKLLTGLREAARIPEIFHDLEISSPLLAKVVRHPGRGGCFPDIQDELNWFFENFDCEKAAQGLFEPSEGIDALFDEANLAKDRIENDLEHFKQEMCQKLRPSSQARSNWKYANTKPDSKDKYLIELPASVQVPGDWLMKGKRGKGPKQVNKYMAPIVADLVQDLERAFDTIAGRKTKAVQLIFARFDSKRKFWEAVATATAILDALCALAQLASQPGYSRPEILEYETHSIFSCKQGRHPCVEGSSGSSEFIPNDLELGTEQEPERVLLLNGPNMGGKSTMLRQTCLIAILAQIGSFVPAAECRLTPVDRIYTRLGASDRILLGQSTFFVELSETASALRGATDRSLVIMDELGRGTSTFDGTAIASATVKHLVERNKCIALFATHYHNLLDDWADNPLVRLGHMECMVENDGNGGPSRVTFLYTLGKGACPKSFGINVARLAGLPNDVLLKAEMISNEFEQELGAGSVRAKVEQAVKDGNMELVRRLWQQVQN